MSYGAQAFNQPLDGWITACTNMSGMFIEAEEFYQPLKGWLHGDFFTRSSTKASDIGVEPYNAGLSFYQLVQNTDE